MAVNAGVTVLRCRYLDWQPNGHPMRCMGWRLVCPETLPDGVQKNSFEIQLKVPPS